MPASQSNNVAVKTWPWMTSGIIASTAVRAMAAARNASEPFARRDRIPARRISRSAAANKTPVGTKTGWIIGRPLSAANRREDHDRVVRRQRRIATLHLAHIVPVDENDNEVPQLAIFEHPAFELVPVPRHEGPQ